MMNPDFKDDQISPGALIGMGTLLLTAASFALSLRDDYSGYRIIEGGDLSMLSESTRAILSPQNVDSGKLIAVSGFLERDAYRTEHDPNENQIYKLHIGRDPTSKQAPYIYISVAYYDLKPQFEALNNARVSVNAKLKPYFPDKTAHLYCDSDAGVRPFGGRDR